MNNTLQNTVRWSDDDRYLVINTRNKQGKLHSWEWVINENELNDYTEWDYKDMATVTDDQIRECFSGILADLPDGVRIVTEFVWRVRWFLLVGWLGWLTFQVVTQVLPYLMWTWVIKSIVGSVFSFL